MKLAVIYTDGSYDKVLNRCGSAFIALDKDENELTRFNETYSSKTTSWNIEAEINSVHLALDWCEENGYKDIIFYCDLTNCVNHLNGDWKGKQEQSLRLYHRSKELKTKGYKIEAYHVKGHSGNKWNELVDSLCSVDKKEVKEEIPAPNKEWFKNWFDTNYRNLSKEDKDFLVSIFGYILRKKKRNLK